MKKISWYSPEVIYTILEILQLLDTKDDRLLDFLFNKLPIPEGVKNERISPEWSLCFITRALLSPFKANLELFNTSGKLLEEILNQITPRIILMELPSITTGITLNNNNIIITKYDDELTCMGATFYVFIHELGHLLQRWGCATYRDCSRPFSADLDLIKDKTGIPEEVKTPLLQTCVERDKQENEELVLNRIKEVTVESNIDKEYCLSKNKHEEIENCRISKLNIKSEKTIIESDTHVKDKSQVIQCFEEDVFAEVLMEEKAVRKENDFKEVIDEFSRSQRKIIVDEEIKEVQTHERIIKGIEERKDQSIKSSPIKEGGQILEILIFGRTYEYIYPDASEYILKCKEGTSPEKFKKKFELKNTEPKNVSKHSSSLRMETVCRTWIRGCCSRYGDQYKIYK